MRIVSHGNAGFFGLALCFAVACSSDDDSGGGAGGAGGAGASGGSAGSAGSSGSGGSAGSAGAGASGGSSGAAGAGGGAGSAGAAGGASCDALPSGPFTPTIATEKFSGSEDITFDGKGAIVGKDGANLIKVLADDTTSIVANVPGQMYGVRYGSTGDLFAALPTGAKVVRITPAGVVSDFLGSLAGPNGVYVDFDDTVYITEFGNNRVLRVPPGGSAETVADGPLVQQPNGVVLDVSRNLLFFTAYSAGRVLRVDPAGATEPVEVTQITGAALDGLVLDTCGNLYAVDNGGNRLFRVRMDASGVIQGQPEHLADFPENVANAQFGSGTGWAATSLYVAGNPGVVYEVQLGVAGAQVPTEP